VSLTLLGVRLQLGSRIRYSGERERNAFDNQLLEDYFAYANGALNGNGGWSGSAGSGEIAIESQTVRINGGATSYDANKTVTCGDPGPATSSSPPRSIAVPGLNDLEPVHR